MKVDTASSLKKYFSDLFASVQIRNIGKVRGGVDKENLPAHEVVPLRLQQQGANQLECGFISLRSTQTLMKNTKG